MVSLGTVAIKVRMDISEKPSSVHVSPFNIKLFFLHSLPFNFTHFCTQVKLSDIQSVVLLLKCTADVSFPVTHVCMFENMLTF